MPRPTMRRMPRVIEARLGQLVYEVAGVDFTTGS